MAFEFNPFSQFWWPGENKTSELLRFFLDPNEKHAQGNIYLSIFLKSIDREDLIEIAEGEKVTVVCEDRTMEGRRIDIVITIGDNEFIIGIENKIHVWTQDQANQLSDYNKELKSRTKGGYLLIYLAPEDKQPSEASMPPEIKKELEAEDSVKSLFKIINYENHIISCVKQWVQVSQPIRVKSFLQDFQNYLNEQYKGEKFMQENDSIVAQALKPENIEVALLVSNSIETVKKKLLIQLYEQLSEILSKEGFTTDNQNGEWGIINNESYLSFSLPQSKYKTSIMFGFEKYKSDFSIGVFIDKESWPENYPELRKAVSDNLSFLGPDKGLDNWLYLHYQTDDLQNWNSNMNLWIGISSKEKETALRLSKIVKTIYDKIKDVGV
jgi:hypothetical protein